MQNKVETDLHTAKAIAIKMEEIEEYAKLLLKEVRTMRSFIHGKFNLKDNDEVAR